MKPQCLVLVCLFVAVALPTPLMGAGAVYFTAASASPAGSVSHQGARGEALELECDANLAFTCTWDISGWYQNDDGGAFGWSLDVGILDPTVFGKATVSNIEIPISEITSISHLVGANEPDGFLIHGAAGANLSGPGPAIWNVLNFRFAGEVSASSSPQIIRAGILILPKNSEVSFLPSIASSDPLTPAGSNCDDFIIRFSRSVLLFCL